jgi:SAM-dependent methyltransferase
VYNPCGGLWSSYEDFLSWIEQTEPYSFEIIRKHVWTEKKVLDAGCGQGTLLNFLPPLGAKMFGLDMSRQSLHQAAAGARELGFSELVHLSQGDGEFLPFHPSSFDAVICFGVLHHTRNTAQGVKELWRVLKPGGLAIVMLYRKGNPKWWMTRLFRGISELVDAIRGKRYVIASWLRVRQKEDDIRGTALLELFGCPILKAFSERQTRKMFAGFSEVGITKHQPGFVRMADILPMLQPFKKVFLGIDRKFKNSMGFYQVIEARK